MTDDAHIDEPAVEAGEYVLGLMTDRERRRFEARLNRSPAQREEVERWTENFVQMTAAMHPVDPPAALQDKIERQLFGRGYRREKAARKSGRRAGGGFAPLRFLGGIATAAVILLAVYAAIITNGPTSGPGPLLEARIAAPDDSLVVTAAFDPGDALLTVERVAGEAPTGRVLEMWLIAGGDAPVSLGLLPEAGAGEVPIDPDLADRLPGATLAISEEPPGGSPTGAPTGDVLATGQISTL